MLSTGKRIIPAFPKVQKHTINVIKIKGETLPSINEQMKEKCMVDNPQSNALFDLLGLEYVLTVPCVFVLGKCYKYEFVITTTSYQYTWHKWKNMNTSMTKR